MKALKIFTRIVEISGAIFVALLTAAIWLFSILARIITGIAHKIR